MAENNRNVCKAFKDSRERCIGCMGVCDEAMMSVQLFESTDDCEKHVQEHCMQGGEGCPVSEILGQRVGE